MERKNQARRGRKQTAKHFGSCFLDLPHPALFLMDGDGWMDGWMDGWNGLIIF